MKKIINGKTYNTETATELGHYRNVLSGSDFFNVSEWLYMTRKGAYFLCGEGGAASSWGEACGDSWTGGSDIRVMSESEALHWMSRHCDAEDTALVNEIQAIRKAEEEEQKYQDEQRTYRSKCDYLLRKLGLEMDYLDRGYPSPHGPDGRVWIDKTHEYYDELVEFWGLNLDADMVWTGDYENSYKSHYEDLKKCDEVIKKAKAKRQEVTA